MRIRLFNLMDQKECFQKWKKIHLKKYGKEFDEFFPKPKIKYGIVFKLRFDTVCL